MKPKIKLRPYRWPGTVILVVWCAFSVFSLLWIAGSSLKTNREFFSSPWQLFEIPQFQNFANVWENYKLGSYFINSLLTVLVAEALLLAVAAPASYIIARVKFKAVKIVGRIVIFGMGVPTQLLVIPLYFQLSGLGLRDSLPGLILVYATVQIPYTCFLVSGFFRSLPFELEEAAMVDGAGSVRTFLSVMLPLGRSGIITAAILNFITLWNEFLLSYTFLENSKNYTLSVGLYNLNASMQYTGEWTTLMAGFVIVIIPTLAVFLLLSRQIIEGLAIGAVKG